MLNRYLHYLTQIQFKIMLLFNLLFVLLFSPSVFLSYCNEPETSKEQSSQKSLVSIYQIDPLEKILLEQNDFTDNQDTIRVARGEVATVQLLVKSFDKIVNPQMNVRIFSENNTATNLKSNINWVGYVGATNKFEKPSSVILSSPSNKYPDVLFPIGEQGHDYAKNQPFWITIPIPENIVPGIYKGQFTLDGQIDNNDEELKKTFIIRVYPPVINKTSLMVSNWNYFDSNILAYMNNEINVKKYSVLYWNLVKQFADVAWEYKFNVHFINPVEETSYKTENGRYSFDFSNFDKQINLFQKARTIARIEGGHVAIRSGNWESPFLVKVPEVSGKTNTIRYYPMSDSRVSNFYSQFLPALKEHLIEKGWYYKYMQHIADEPISVNADSYKQISNMIRMYMPDVKIIEATYAAEELSSYIDIWTPILGIFHNSYPYFEDLINRGTEVWFYTCTGPQGEYANRFIQLPLIQPRLLHWINFKYNSVGYLHWATNHWLSATNPFQETTNLKEGWNGGDAFVLYPGYRKLYSSIRLHAIRDGITDYELLKMLKEKNPTKAKELADKAILSFDKYNNSVEHFRGIRKILLEELSK